MFLSSDFIIKVFSHVSKNPSESVKFNLIHFAIFEMFAGSRDKKSAQKAKKRDKINDLAFRAWQHQRPETATGGETARLELAAC